ncbi:MAG: hypothetical protein AAGG44_20775 [Planctomycetota bacterium]
MAAKCDPDELTPEERFQLIASILGAGLILLSKRKRLLKDSEQQSENLRQSLATRPTIGLSLRPNPG